MADRIRWPDFDAARAPSVTDQLVEALYGQIVTLELPPGTRLSEAEVAGRMGVSRQPVRDAFWRLSQLGFLTIRPQRATEVTEISEAAVLQARFIRTALEIETIRVATERLSAPDLAVLDALLDDQADAVADDDRGRFHDLDDTFHKRICELAGLDFAWTLIRQNKAHMDRVRFLSLSFGAQTALDDHRRILEALKAREAAAAIAAVREHLGRIEDILARLHRTHAELFAVAARAL